MSLMRSALLAASTNHWLREHAVRQQFVRRSVARFMPGERLDDAIDAAVRQRADGVGSILTHLGENLAHVEEAELVTAHYLDVIDRVAVAALDAEIAVKLTQLGLDQDRGLCQRNVDRLIDRAIQCNSFVWIDMESSPHVDATLGVFRASRSRSPRVGIALQACLYRTADDIEALLPQGAAIRLVKGAYLEPKAIAYSRKRDVDENYYRLACRVLDYAKTQPASRLHLATHDTSLAERLLQFIAEQRVPSTAFEFAMLYGINRGQQRALVGRGLPLRVLISYGEHWFPWYMRRLAERPANVAFVLRNLVG